MRLIDADALSKDLEKRWNVNDDQDFCNKEVWHALEEAPTIEPDGDTISRRALMKRISEEYHKYGDEYDALQILGDIEDFPSTPDTNQHVQHVLCVDLISRQDAIDALMNDSDWADAIPTIKSLPSAPDSRQRGEWVGCTGCEHYDQQQTRLICHECKRYYSDKYKGGEEE